MKKESKNLKSITERNSNDKSQDINTYLPIFTQIPNIDPLEECYFKIHLIGRYTQNDKFLRDFQLLLNKYDITIDLKPWNPKK